MLQTPVWRKIRIGSWIQQARLDRKSEQAIIEARFREANNLRIADDTPGAQGAINMGFNEC
jgi:hypothetical protein